MPAFHARALQSPKRLHSELSQENNAGWSQLFHLGECKHDKCTGMFVATLMFVGHVSKYQQGWQNDDNGRPGTIQIGSTLLQCQLHKKKKGILQAVANTLETIHGKISVSLLGEYDDTQLLKNSFEYLPQPNISCSNLTSITTQLACPNHGEQFVYSKDAFQQHNCHDCVQELCRKCSACGQELLFADYKNHVCNGKEALQHEFEGIIVNAVISLPVKPMALMVHNFEQEPEFVRQLVQCNLVQRGHAGIDDSSCIHLHKSLPFHSNTNAHEVTPTNQWLVACIVASQLLHKKTVHNPEQVATFVATNRDRIQEYPHRYLPLLQLAVGDFTTLSMPDCIKEFATTISIHGYMNWCATDLSELLFECMKYKETCKLYYLNYDSNSDEYALQVPTFFVPKNTK